MLKSRNKGVTGLIDSLCIEKEKYEKLRLVCQNILDNLSTDDEKRTLLHCTFILREIKILLANALEK